MKLSNIRNHSPRTNPYNLLNYFDILIAYCANTPCRSGKVGRLSTSSRFISFVIFLSLVPNLSDAQIDIGDIAELALPAVVVIETPTSTGSGVIIDSSGVVVTNFHVVADSSSLQVKLGNGDEFDNISIIDYDEIRDIVLLKIQGFDLPYVQMGNSNSVEVGDDVVVMGAPRGFEQSVTRGIVSAIRDSGNGYRLIQTDAAISPGSSGGGMFNSEGDLIGISVSYIEDAQNINFVIPINYVRGMYSVDPQYSLPDFLALQNGSNSTARGTSTASSSNSLDDLISGFESEVDLDFEYLEENDTWYVIDGDQILTVRDLGGIVVTSVYEIEQEEFRQQQLLEFLKLSYLSNYGKVAIEDDNTLVVLNEAPLESLTQEHFSTIISALLTLTDEIKVVLTNDNEQQSTNNISPPSRSTNLANNKPDLLEDAIIAQYPKKDFLGGNFSVRLDPGRWEIDTENTISIDDDFQYVANDTWIRIIAEEAELGYEYMLEAILSNAQDADPNARIIENGFRNVNNINIMWATIDAEVTSIPITYYYHVYTGTEGTVQIISFTMQNIFENRLELIEEVASSFKIQP